MLWPFDGADMWSSQLLGLTDVLLCCRHQLNFHESVRFGEANSNKHYHDYLDKPNNRCVPIPDRSARLRAHSGLRSRYDRSVLIRGFAGPGTGQSTSAR